MFSVGTECSKKDFLLKKSLPSETDAYPVIPRVGFS